MGDFRKLEVWKKSRRLLRVVYRLTTPLPFDERYGLRAQIRGAAISIMANIAEGCGRNRDRELARFLEIALGSAAELESHFVAAMDQRFLEAESAAAVILETREIRRMLAGLRRKLQS